MFNSVSMRNTICNVAMGAFLVGAVHAGTILYDSGDPPQGLGPGLFSNQWFAQAFTGGTNWQMGIVGVFAAGTQPVTMILAQDAAGGPGTILGTWTIGKSDWDAGGSWGYTAASFSFLSGVKYWFEYSSSADIFGGDFLPIPAPSGDPDLAFSFDQGASWVSASGAGPLGLRIETADSIVIPEPGSLTLLAVGLLLVFGLFRTFGTTWSRHG